MTLTSDFERKVLELREAFDQSFARAPRPAEGDHEDLLLVRVGRAPYALRLRETLGLAKNRKIVPVPTGRSDVLGVAGIRGSVVPVYDLAILLGHSRDEAAPVWLALAGSPDPVALAFGGLEGFARTPRTDIHSATSRDGVKSHVREVVTIGALPRPIVDIPSALGAIRTVPGGSVKEQ
jgi:chemotaxis signal transduction protein